MKNMLKTKKGITLVALVVTIIILLILAGISIATLTGSGLFEKAKLAEQESKNAQELEEITLKDYEDTIGEYVDGNRDTITIDKEEYEQLKNNFSFSEEEKLIGTWIDGKKLYRRILKYDLSNLTSNNDMFIYFDTEHDRTYYDYMDFEGKIVLPSEVTGTVLKSVPLNYYVEEDIFVRTNIQYNKTAKKWLIYLKTNYDLLYNNKNGSSVYIIMQYTKSVDN